LIIQNQSLKIVEDQETNSKSFSEIMLLFLKSFILPM